jgi:hypothetical protein
MEKVYGTLGDWITYDQFTSALKKERMRPAITGTHRNALLDKDSIERGSVVDISSRGVAIRHYVGFYMEEPDFPVPRTQVTLTGEKKNLDAVIRALSRRRLLFKNAPGFGKLTLRSESP